ncbi:SUMF1/EgtB/PvdO family nonheme iron enzyme [candidate division KSB1 bacterium]|nr:SUMF1/EgtB/PvdO family nonheme iron enzyme [bacterium]NUM67528.1 SUMF1/EgtB/PvdO family nonheme iron enzyme [candidate division KSB1 bacterium]
MIPTDPFSANFLSSLAANLATQLIDAAIKRMGSAFLPSAKQAALKRCLHSGIVAIAAAASKAEKDNAGHLAEIFEKFFQEPDVGKQLVRLLRSQPLDRAELAFLFQNSGYDAGTLPHLNFDQCLNAFEAAFLTAALDEPELREVIQAAEMLKQTHLQQELLAAVRGLIAFLKQAHLESLHIQAGLLTALAESDGRRLDFQWPKTGDVTISGSVHGSIIVTAPNVTVTQTNTFTTQDKHDHARQALRHAYLNHLFSEARKLSLSGIDPKAASSEQESRLQLDAVYTALFTQSAEAWEAGGKPGRMEREQRRLSALEQLNQHQRLVLLGDPGSGKSTFVNFVTLCLAGEALEKEEANLKLLTQPLPSEKEEDKKRPQPWLYGALLPVRVILRDFAATGLPAAGTAATAQHLWQFLAAELERHNLGDFAPHLRTELLNAGGLLLLDGLDEVPEAHQRRQQLKQAVEDFVSCYGKCRVLVTSRTYAYQKQDWRLNGFAETVLAPFIKPQIENFVDHWYNHIAKLRGMNPDDAQGRAVLLKRAISASTSLQGLAERPLLLTLMASLHAWRGGSLPEKREELYSDTVDLLLDWWESPKVVREPDGQVRVLQPSLAEYLKVDRKKVRELLHELAFQAHAAQPDLAGTADVAEEKLISGLLRLNTNPDVRPQRLIEYLSQRAGLLLPRGVQVYTFPHRTFQEYLTACYLTDHDYPDTVARLARQDPNRWREVALLAGAKAAGGSASTIWLLVDALCENDYSAEAVSAADVWGAHLAGQALAEAGDLKQLNPRNQNNLARVQEWLKQIMRKSDFPATERALAGNSLAQLGDPRPEVMTLDHLEFCLVPAGDFWMGHKDEGEEAAPHLNKQLSSDYWISRFPITVAQFQLFVNATEHKLGNPGCLKDPANRPVRWVSWYEAMEFCDWLTQHWRKQGLLPKQWRVQLPSEAEWEKAARGGLKVPKPPLVRPVRELAATTLKLTANEEPQRRFPWGENADANRANYVDTKINDPSAVGCFPGGKSLCGCEEMAGNVWEWTRSLWGKDFMTPEFKYPYDPADGRENINAPSEILRVLRGGAFSGPQGYVRCACRNRTNPDHRNFNFGFRVVVSPSL